ncbi:hypothetical protein [Shimia sp. R9_3]|uniref:hypothetical protein n=1 Tax=Shimia sp. R9_3 TaxID=2821113 RepID=UPI001ADB150A|nr:hypothetical protein [Shimia sp. R9_3]MBO9402047.1 hypothetical protein [Shimia sp. R9_3]
MKCFLGFSLFAIVGVAGCAQVSYNDVKAGEFVGKAQLYWVGSAIDAPLGDGQFLYVPHTTEPLVFRRDPSNNPAPGSEIITPEAFYTDGGSIPRGVQALRGFNAWTFGPAYIVHDWAFVARKCMNDEARGDGDVATEEMEKLANMTFQDSVVLMAETIKTIVNAEDIEDETRVAGSVITSVTAGPISRSLWEKEGACKDQTPKDLNATKVAEVVRAGRVAALQKLNGRTDALSIPLPDGKVAVEVGNYSLYGRD